MKKWLYWAAGGLALMAFWILGGPARAATKAAQQRDDLLLLGSGRAKAQAHKAGIIVLDNPFNNYLCAGVI